MSMTRTRAIYRLGGSTKGQGPTTNFTNLTRLRFGKAYLDREADGFTLVNTTTSGGDESVISAGARGGEAIRQIALIHSHGDHIGSLDALSERLRETAQVLMRDLDTYIHAGESVIERGLPGSWPKLQTVPDARLMAADRVGSLEVVPAPAMPGHVAILDTLDGALIAEEMFSLTPGSPWQATSTSASRWLRWTLGSWPR